MTKKFEQKIIHMGIVDTQKYRYRFVSAGNGYIERIEIDKLDTDTASDWEIVKRGEVPICF